MGVNLHCQLGGLFHREKHPTGNKKPWGCPSLIVQSRNQGEKHHQGLLRGKRVWSVSQDLASNSNRQQQIQKHSSSHTVGPRDGRIIVHIWWSNFEIRSKSTSMWSRIRWIITVEIVQAISGILISKMPHAAYQSDVNVDLLAATHFRTHAFHRLKAYSGT